MIGSLCFHSNKMLFGCISKHSRFCSSADVKPMSNDLAYPMPVHLCLCPQCVFYILYEWYIQQNYFKCMPLKLGLVL